MAKSSNVNNTFTQKTRYGSNIIGKSWWENEIKWIPFILFVNMLPFIVKMHHVKVHGPMGYWMSPSTEYLDVFAYYKLILLYASTFGALIYLMIEYFSYHSNKMTSYERVTFRNFWKNTPENRLFKIFYKKDILLFILMLIIILASLFSAYKPVTYFGYMERMLGMFSWLSFIIMFFYVRNIIKDEHDVHVAIKRLIVTAFFLGVVGFMQSQGHDPFRTDFFKRLIATKSMIQNNMLDSISFTFPLKMVYMTVYNPNNVGVIVAGLVPIAIYIMMYVKNMIFKIIAALSCILLVLSLWFSESSAGLVAVAGSFAVYFLFQSVKHIKSGGVKRVFSIGVIMVTLAAIVVGGYIVKQTWLVTDEASGIPSISIEERQCVVKYNGKEVFFKYGEDEQTKLCTVRDVNGKDYSLTQDPNTAYISFEDEQLVGFTFGYGMIDEGLYIELDMSTLKLPLLMADDGFKYISGLGRIIDVQEVKTKGFENHQKMGTMRGYIWSKIIPILSENMFIGSGADTFPYRFPQHDLAGKLIHYYEKDIVVDKAHNQYFSWWLEFGFIALMLFVVWIGQVIINSRDNLMVVALLGILLNFIFTDFSIYTGWLFITLMGILDAQVYGRDSSVEG